jgi:hypothetical protein
MRKTLLLLTTMTLALLLAAGVALAQATTTHLQETLPVDFTLDQTEGCSGELVPLTGQLNSVFHITEDAAGGIHVATEFNFANVQGTGEVSGGQYRVPTVSRSTATTDSDGFPVIVSEETSSIVIGQGQLPDERVHFTFHITINENETVTADVFAFRAECK